MKSVAKIIVLAVSLFSANVAIAETFTFDAVTDFTDIEAGEVPYYRHTNVGALAINASQEDYREKYARATLEFTGSAGVYDVTITSLGEIDGDGEFRFLVNGELIGAAVNEPATQDYQPQLHTFTGITIPAGAELGVESSAVSNGLIPEGDAFAFARGRWTTLTLESVSDVAPDPIQTVDLTVSMIADDTTATTNETVTYTASVENLTADVVATNPVLTITFPDTFNAIAGEGCTLTSTSQLSCATAELTGNEKTEFAVSATPVTSGEYQLTAEASADQPDNDGSNNSVSLTTVVNETIVETTIVEPTPVDDSVVDLAISIEADNSQVVVGDNINYTLNLSNLSTTTTATAPVAGVHLPETLQFLAGDGCTASGQSVTCETAELPPGSAASISFTVLTISVNSYAQLFVSASSTQPESDLSNNEAQLISSVSTDVLRNIDTDMQTASQAASGTDSTEQIANNNTANTKEFGSGSMQITLLAMLMLCGLLRWRSTISSGIRLVNGLQIRLLKKQSLS